ncbi:MAG: energy transducer TonB [Nitrospirota bacterium]
MNVGKWIGGGVTVGVLLSTLVHAGAAGGLYYAFVIDRPEPIEVDIDLSMVPLVPPDPAPPAPIQPVMPPPPPPAWTLPKPQELPPPVVEEEVPEPDLPPTPVAAETVPEPQETPPALVEQVAAVSRADVESQYLTADQLTRRPRWIKNFITDHDYPRVAEREGKDGRVLLTVFIDETGLVKDVRLMQGSYEVLNEVALRKVREAVFTPAYNAEGRPVPAKVALPIKFELQ